MHSCICEVGFISMKSESKHTELLKASMFMLASGITVSCTSQICAAVEPCRTRMHWLRLSRQSPAAQRKTLEQSERIQEKQLSGRIRLVLFTPKRFSGVVLFATDTSVQGAGLCSGAHLLLLFMHLVSVWRVTWLQLWGHVCTFTNLPLCADIREFMRQLLHYLKLISVLFHSTKRKVQSLKNLSNEGFCSLIIVIYYQN